MTVIKEEEDATSGQQKMALTRVKRSNSYCKDFLLLFYQVDTIISYIVFCCYIDGYCPYDFFVNDLASRLA